jgi:hypothetical protein
VTARRKGERGVWELGGERLKIWLSQRLKKERPELVKLVNVSSRISFPSRAWLTIDLS